MQHCKASPISSALLLLTPEELIHRITDLGKPQLNVDGVQDNMAIK